MTSPDQWSSGRPDSGWGDVQEMAGEFGDFLKNPISAIAQMVFRSISNIFGMGDRGLAGLQEWVDGQTELNDRTDLLSPLLDYGSAYMKTRQNLNGAGQMPFSNQVGPMQGCHLSGGRIVLHDQGLWDIRCQLWFDYIQVLSGRVDWEIRVLRPDDSVYSKQLTILDSQAPISSTNITSVVVPEPGYQVQIWVSQISDFRGILGGPAMNRLTVQHISRDVSSGDTGQG